MSHCGFFSARRPSSSPLVPYTTLFRSVHFVLAGGGVAGSAGLQVVGAGRADDVVGLRAEGVPVVGGKRRRGRQHVKRSEEHTSELQSLRHLVCRLLLEKKKG